MAAGKTNTSGKKATRNWLHQRLTALILFPLVVWFVTSIVMMAGADYDVVLVWLTHPVIAVFMVVMIGAGFYHLSLGVREVIEDYIATPSTKKTLLGLNAAFAIIFGGVALVSMFRIYF